MFKTIERLTILAVLASVVAPVVVSDAVAQTTTAEQHRQQEMARRVPVTIALTQSLPAGTSGAAILRRVNLEPHDVILLADPGATADQLSAALFTLMATRELMGDTAKANATVRVASAVGPEAWAHTETPRAGRTLDRLRNSVPRDVAGVGVVRAYKLYLLPHKLRGQMNAGNAGMSP